jgi:hypothetical protein
MAAKLKIEKRGDEILIVHCCFRISQKTIKISSPLFSIFSLAAILARSRDHRTQFWKRAIQGPFHQSLVAIGPVVSKSLYFECCVHICFWNNLHQVRS